MPKIIMTAVFDVMNRLSGENGNFEFEVKVPKAWEKWNDDRKSAWINRNESKINRIAYETMFVGVEFDEYKDTDNEWKDV